MARRSGALVAVRGRAPRRQTAWISSVDETAFTGLSGNAAVLAGAGLNAAGLALRPFTVVRVRGLFSCKSDQIANIEEPFGAVGFAVVSDDAAAVGITAVPDPVTDEGSDLWYSLTFWSAGFTISSAVGIARGMQTFEIDSKAMRKVGIGQNLVIVVGNGNTTQAVEFLVKYRILVKLH